MPAAPPVEEIHGWQHLRTDADRKLAQLMLDKFMRELRVPSIRAALGRARAACVRAELDDHGITGEYETVYAVFLDDSRVVCGIAPTLRSARRRARQLLRHGYCRAAGIHPERIR